MGVINHFLARLGRAGIQLTGSGVPPSEILGVSAGGISRRLFIAREIKRP